MKRYLARPGMIRLFYFFAVLRSFLLTVSINIAVGLSIVAIGASIFLPFMVSAGGPDLELLMLLGVLIGLVGAERSARIAIVADERLDGQPAADELLHARCTILANRAAIPAPQIRIAESHFANAYSLPVKGGFHSIVVTSGLIRLLKPGELDAVLAHEIAHIKSGDPYQMRLAEGCCHSIDFLGNLRDRFTGGFSEWESLKATAVPLAKAYFLSLAGLVLMAMPFYSVDHGLDMGDAVNRYLLYTALFIIGTTGGLWLIVLGIKYVLTCLKHVSIRQLMTASFLSVVSFPLTWIFASRLFAYASFAYIARRKEKKADAIACHLTGEPQVLASALTKLYRVSPAPSLGTDTAISLTAIVPLSGNRSGRGIKARLTSSHPSLEDRISLINEPR